MKILPSLHLILSSIWGKKHILMGKRSIFEKTIRFKIQLLKAMNSPLNFTIMAQLLSKNKIYSFYILYSFMDVILVSVCTFCTELYSTGSWFPNWEVGHCALLYIASHLKFEILKTCASRMNNVFLELRSGNQKRGPQEKGTCRFWQVPFSWGDGTLWGFVVCYDTLRKR